MNHATPKMRYFAQRLIAYEASADPSYLTENQTAFGIIRKLRPQLEELMGTTGFRALVSRSMLLAEEEAPGMSGTRMNLDGSFGGTEEIQVNPDEQAIATGGVVMLAWLLGLLGSFIGELLTMQLVLEVWPDLSLNGYFSQTEFHEEAN
jgi:hypothetical protein